VILRSDLPGLEQLALQGLGQAFGEKHNAALVALGLMQVELPLVEVEVFDSQVEWLADSQATAIKQVDD
jgi:hypothetical protein